MRYLFPLLFVLFFMSGCNQQQSDDKLAINYTIIQAGMEGTTPPQQLFIDALNSTLKDRMVDTSQLFTLLDSAKNANTTRLTLVQSATGTEALEDYRGKCLAYTLHVQKLYNTVFPEVLRMMHTGDAESFYRAAELLSPHLKEMKALQEEMQDAKKAFLEEHDVDETLESLEVGTHKF